MRILKVTTMSLANRLLDLIDAIPRSRGDFNEMIRPRSRMTDLLESDLVEQVGIHLAKLFFYHKIKPNDVNHWIKELNTFKFKFEKCNQGKSKNKHHYSRKDLLYKLNQILLNSNVEIDIELAYLENEGFPSIGKSTKSDLDKMRKLLSKYVDCIIDGTRFTVDKSELR